MRKKIVHVIQQRVSLSHSRVVENLMCGKMSKSLQQIAMVVATKRQTSVLTEALLAA
jgi:hypothetical protein